MRRNRTINITKYLLVDFIIYGANLLNYFFTIIKIAIQWLLNIWCWFAHLYSEVIVVCRHQTALNSKGAWFWCWFIKRNISRQPKRYAKQYLMQLCIKSYQKYIQTRENKNQYCLILGCLRRKLILESCGCKAIAYISPLLMLLINSLYIHLFHLLNI